MKHRAMLTDMPEIILKTRRTLNPATLFRDLTMALLQSVPVRTSLVLLILTDPLSKPQVTAVLPAAVVSWRRE